MALLPIDLPTGTVTGTFYFVDEDGVDADTKPELTVVTGTVTFTSSAKVLRMVSKSATVIPLVFDAKFDGNGNLVPRKGNGNGIELPATDSPLINPINYTWRVTFNLREVETGHTVNIDPFDIQIPTGQTIDLTAVMPVDTTPGTLTLKGPPGPPGPAGAGVPNGGGALQVIRKTADNTTTEWASLTKALVGLGSVDNTSDLAKPVSADTQAALQLKADTSALNTLIPRNQTGVLVTGSSDYVFIKDTSGATGSVLRMEDTETHDGSVLHIAHRGGVGTPGQAYGINLANYPGAKGGFIGHQYSKASPFMQIDNTDLNAAIYIRNTPNTTQNPDGVQIGDFFQLKPGSEVSNRLILKDNLTFWNQTSLDFKVQADNATNYAFGVQTVKDITGLSVTKSGTGTGDAVTVTNAGTYPGLRINQNGASNALLITATGSVMFGKAAARISGNTHAAQFDINADGGSALLVNKTSTGNGDTLRIINPGTGASADIRNASGTVATINPNGEYENKTAGAGPIIKSPNGTRYRITVSDAGAITATAA